VADGAGDECRHDQVDGGVAEHRQFERSQRLALALEARFVEGSGKPGQIVQIQGMPGQQLQIAAQGARCRPQGFKPFRKIWRRSGQPL